MFGFKKKKKDDIEKAAEDVGEVIDEIEKEVGAEDAAGKKPAEKPAVKETKISGNVSADITRIGTEIDRLKASVESFGEVRKSLSERMSRTSEQIGELRAMILERDRTIQEIELKAVKASDLVETVQPEKLMVELQKEDAKFEALKANLEGNEAIMDRVMEELRELRRKMDFFKGVEEIVKLSEEVKKELVEIKKVQATIHIDTDKVETIYAELRKKYQDVELFNDNLQEFKVAQQQNTKDLENIKMKMSGLADKSEVEKLTTKVQRYVEGLKELNKSSALSKDLGQLRKILDNLN